MNLRNSVSSRTPGTRGLYILALAVLFAVNTETSIGFEQPKKLIPRQTVSPTVRLPLSKPKYQQEPRSHFIKPESAQDQPSTPRIDADGKLCAPNGICLVALVQDGKQQPVSLQHRTTYLGRTYYFSSAEAVRDFESSPSAYLPAHGGFDVCVVHRRGELVRGRLEHAQWYQQKLYLFESSATQADAISLGLLGEAAARDLAPQIRLAHERTTTDVTHPRLPDMDVDEAEQLAAVNLKLIEVSSSDEEEGTSDLEIDSENPPSSTTPLVPEPRRFPDDEALTTRPVERSTPSSWSKFAGIGHNRAPIELTPAFPNPKSIQQTQPRRPQAERYWCRIYLRSTTPQSRRGVQVKLTFPPQEQIIAGRGPTRCLKKGQTIQFEPITELHLGEREYFEVLVDSHHPDPGKLIVDVEEKNRPNTNTAGRGWQLDVEFLPTKPQQADDN